MQPKASYVFPMTPFLSKYPADLSVRFLAIFRIDCQHIVLDGNCDVLFVHAGQLGPDFVMIFHFPEVDRCTSGPSPKPRQRPTVGQFSPNS